MMILASRPWIRICSHQMDADVGLLRGGIWKTQTRTHMPTSYSMVVVPPFGREAAPNGGCSNMSGTYVLSCEWGFVNQTFEKWWVVVNFGLAYPSSDFLHSMRLETSPNLILGAAMLSTDGPALPPPQVQVNKFCSKVCPSLDSACLIAFHWLLGPRVQLTALMTWAY